RRAEGHVGERLHRRLHRFLGNHDVEVREVERGRRVRAPAAALDRAIDVTRSPLVRALEQHVLLEVRVAELVRALVADPDAHVEVDRDDVSGAVILHDQPEAVGQDLAHRRRQLAARGARTARRARAARPAGTASGQEYRRDGGGDDGAASGPGSPHRTRPVSSSTLPARSTVTLYELPDDFVAMASRIFVRLAASAFMPSTVSRMSPPSGTWSPPRLTIIVAPRSPSCSAGESLATVLMMYPVDPGGRFKRSACWSVSSWPSRPAQKDFFSSKRFFAV